LTTFGSSPSQKSLGRGEANGSLSLVADVVPVAVEVEFTAFCCAQPVTVKADSNVRVMQFLISTFPEWSSTPHYSPVWAYFWMQ